MIARLAQSVYAAEIRDALARYRGSRVVMEACRLHLANALGHMQSFSRAINGVWWECCWQGGISPT